MSFAVGYIDSPTSTGNQAYSESLGFTPKALILWTQGDTTFGDVTAGPTSHGFSDGSNDVTQYAADDGSSVGGAFRSDAVLDTGESLVATVVSLDSGGFTLNFSSVEASARKIGYIAIGGDEITDVEVGSASPGAGSGNVEVNLTGSFEPGLVFLMGDNDGDNNFSFGWTVGTAVGDEGAMSTRFRGGAQDAGYVWANDACFLAADDQAARNAEAALASFDADGFTLARAFSSDALNLGYLAIKGGSFSSGNIQSPASATTTSATGEAFEPEGVITINAPGTGTDSDEENTYIGAGAYDGTNELALSLSKNGNSNEHFALKDTKSVTLYDSAGTLVEEADGTSLDSDGFTYTYTTAEAAQNRILYLVTATDSAGGSHSLTANDIESASEVDTPAITQVHGLTASDIESASEVETPALTQVHGLTANDVESASEVETPALTQVHGLTASDVESASEVETPAITQVHSLTGSDVESASEVENPALTQVHSLTGNDVESTSEVESPSLTQVHGLSANDIESASEVDTPTLTQVHGLTANDIESASEVDNPTLTESGADHLLTANDVESASEIDAPALTQVHSLTAGDIESASEVDTPAPTQVHSLTGNDIESVAEVDSPILTVAGIVVEPVDGGSSDRSKYRTEYRRRLRRQLEEDEIMIATVAAVLMEQDYG